MFQVMYDKQAADKQKSKSTEQTSSVARVGRIGLIIIVFCFLGIMPLLVWWSIPPTSTYATVQDASSYVATASADTGLQICTQNTIILDYTGAQNAAAYNLSPDCKTANNANTIRMFVIGFSSPQAQANAIYTAQDTFKNWQMTNTEVFTAETNVMIVTGPPTDPGVQKIGDSLIAQGAQQIT
jgi:hypothetical protein